jgi:excisionase family DNA binding protein
MPTRANERRKDDRLLTPSQVAHAFDVNVETVRTWVKKGVIAHYLIGPFRAVRISRQEAARHFTPVAGAKL